MDNKQFDKLKEKYITRGRQLLKSIEVYQQEVAKMALELCEIRHGGRSPGIYTLKKYAEDIGIHQKTLWEWVSVYRNVVQKCELEIKTPKDWSNARKTDDHLKKERTSTNVKEGKKGTRTAYKKDVNPAKVRSIYDSFCNNEKPFSIEFTTKLQALKNIKHVIFIRDLNIIDDHRLIEMMNLLDECSDTINNFLTQKQRKLKQRIVG